MFDVFLSHNRRQKAWVRTLYKFLLQHGLKVFFDEESIAPGEDITTGIERGVESSRHVLLILSKESLASKWVAMETQLALNQDPDASQRTLIPVILESVDLKTIRPLIRSKNHIDLTIPSRREDRLRFLLSHLGVANAYGLPKRQLAKLLSTDPSNHEELSVAGLYEVLSWGWDGRTLLEELIKLDYKTTDALTQAHEGDPDQWAPVFMNHPDTWRLLVTAPGNIVGYWHIAPLFPSEYELAKAGRLLDSQITVGTVQLLARSHRINIYFVQVCMDLKYRQLGHVRLLFETFFDVLELLAAEGVFVSEICANAFTDAGIGICRSFKMDFVCKHSVRGAIYSAPISTVLRSSMITNYPELQSRYKEEGLA